MLQRQIHCIYAIIQIQVEILLSALTWLACFIFIWRNV